VHVRACACVHVSVFVCVCMHAFFVYVTVFICTLQVVSSWPVFVSLDDVSQACVFLS